MAKEKRSIKGFRAFIGRINTVFGKTINQNKGGFTLIELLVVVLIIGILTSIALPQYQKAVAKARFAQAKVAATALAEAEEVYYSTFMEYTPILDNLDVSISVTSWPKNCTQTSSSCSYETSWGHCILETSGRVNCQTNKAALAYYLFFENNAWRERAGQKYCFAWGISDPNRWEYKFCQTETGTSVRGGDWADNSGFLYVR